MTECASGAESAWSEDRQSVWQPLVIRMAAHDSAALAELYDLSSPMLYSLALRILRNREDAEEVLHGRGDFTYAHAGSIDPGLSTKEGALLLIIGPPDTGEP